MIIFSLGKKIEILGNNNKIMKFSELKDCKKNEVINSIVCVLQTFPPQKKTIKDWGCVNEKNYCW